MHSSREFNDALHRARPDGAATELSLAIAGHQTRASITAAGNLLDRVRGTRYGKALNYDSGELTSHDIEILRFLSCLELIESDVWHQYDELAGLKPGAPDPYRSSLQSLDPAVSHFVTSCALDEVSHSTYLNTYMDAEGVGAVDLDRHRILRGSRAAGAQNVGRLTSLLHLNLELGWVRQESDAAGRDPRSLSDKLWLIDLPSIPPTDADYEEPLELRAIAKTTAFHLRHFEDVIAALYGELSQKLRRVRILKVIFGIGSNEISHLHGACDLARRAIADLPFRFEHPFGTKDHRLNSLKRDSLKDRVPRTDFPFLAGGPDPNHEAGARSERSGCELAVRTIDRLTQSGVFSGQSPEFMSVLFQMANTADLAIAALS